MYRTTITLMGFLLLLLGCAETGSTQQPEEPSSPGPFQSVGVAEFDQLRDTGKDIVLLDVRTPEEVAEGNIEGSMTIDIYDPGFEAAIGQLDKNKTYLVYCRSGGRSSEACEMMQNAGFNKLYNLEGGYTAWKAAH